MSADSDKYVPPKDIVEAARQLDYSLPLECDDPRYVDTEKGRGDINYNQLFKSMGFDFSTSGLPALPDSSHTLFCGHIGCGKSTELRKLGEKLSSCGLFYVVFIDIARELDANNLQYPDLLMSVTNRLLEQLKKDNINIQSVFMSNLILWFDERIRVNEAINGFAPELNSSVELDTGINSLTNVFNRLANSFRMNSTYKEGLRQLIKNNFTEFADAFHLFLTSVENETKKMNKGQRVLFIVDGTDKLSRADSVRFFIEDSNQLKSIKSHFLLCAPIHLFYSENQVQQRFNYFILPMIKIATNYGKKIRAGYEVMREIVLRRVDMSLFEDPGTFEHPGVIDMIIEFSGGSPRELMRILGYAYLHATDRFTKDTVIKAINNLATDYKRMLAPKGQKYYRLLFNIDNGIDIVDEDCGAIEYLLFNLALFEYDGLFWRSNPVIRVLENYKGL